MHEKKRNLASLQFDILRPALHIPTLDLPPIKVKSTDCLLPYILLMTSINMVTCLLISKVLNLSLQN